jgi:hypothetical protein
MPLEDFAARLLSEATPPRLRSASRRRRRHGNAQRTPTASS